MSNLVVNKVRSLISSLDKQQTSIIHVNYDDKNLSCVQFCNLLAKEIHGERLPIKWFYNNDTQEKNKKSIPQYLMRSDVIVICHDSDKNGHLSDYLNKIINQINEWNTIGIKTLNGFKLGMYLAGMSDYLDGEFESYYKFVKLKKTYIIVSNSTDEEMNLYKSMGLIMI
jgi:hypothetical protein